MEESFLQPIQGYIVHPNIDTIIWKFYDKLRVICEDKACVYIIKKVHEYWKNDPPKHLFIYKYNRELICRHYDRQGIKCKEEYNSYCGTKELRKIIKEYKEPEDRYDNMIIRNNLKF